ncbi:MAG: hypothetical protein KR126chlam1_00772 [Chlamydiae bacterium]|nr:hypothetical protein [Chlamydiota bacterium]
MIGHLNWKHLLFEGIILALLGVLALANPLFVAMSFNVLFGCLLVIVGVVQGIRGFKAEKGEAATLFISSVVALIAGIILFASPMTGVLTLTVLFALYFLIEGIVKMISGWHYRPLKGWLWLFLSGLVSLLFAILIFSKFPTSAEWAIGLYLGLYLLFRGGSLIGLSFYIKKETK